jgi:NIMA-interacting peptidyl-prolyl cis-trans isomerase 1
MSRSKGLPYFFNRDTQQSLWDKPDDLSNDDVRALPGAELLNAQPTSASSTDQRADRIRASHLLVKHSGSRRPSSWKEV